MEKFRIPYGGKDNDSINRTIRWYGPIYDQLMEIVEQNNVSFNRLVNECVKFALSHLEKPEEKNKP